MNFSRINIIFQDIDGCLNPSDGLEYPIFSTKFEPSHIKTMTDLKKCLDQSNITTVIINSGRTKEYMKFLFEGMGDKVTYALLENGALLYSREKDKYIDIAEELKDKDPILAEKFKQINYIDEIKKWFERFGRQIMKEQYRDDFITLKKEANLSFRNPLKEDIEEVKIFFKKSYLSYLQKNFSLKEVQKKMRILQFTNSDHYIDVLAGINKMDGVLATMKILNLKIENCLAIGDFTNDLEVFYQFPNLACPNNAHFLIQAEVQKKSGYLSPFKYARGTMDIYKKVGKK